MIVENTHGMPIERRRRDMIRSTENLISRQGAKTPRIFEQQPLRLGVLAREIQKIIFNHLIMFEFIVNLIVFTQVGLILRKMSFVADGIKLRPRRRVGGGGNGLLGDGRR